MAFNSGINVASSARSEEYFNEVKNIRADKFLIRHIRSLVGTTKLLNACINLNSEQKIAEVPLLNVTELHEFEANDEDANNINKSLDMDVKNDDTEILCKPSNEETHERKSPTLSTFLNDIETWKSHKDKKI